MSNVVHLYSRPVASASSRSRGIRIALAFAILAAAPVLLLMRPAGATANPPKLPPIVTVDPCLTHACPTIPPKVPCTVLQTCPTIPPVIHPCEQDCDPEVTTTTMPPPDTTEPPVVTTEPPVVHENPPVVIYVDPPVIAHPTFTG